MKKNFTISRISGAMLMSFLILSPALFAQGDQVGEKNTGTIKIAANTTYNKAGSVKRMLFGEHYRKEWATPVEVPILDMKVFAGGLTPVKLGGGLQTKSLRLKGADGKEYVLRSVNKDASKAIVTELRNTFAEDIVQDQISSANPYAPMVVASLAKAAGIYNSTPQLVYVQRSEELGVFADTFTETLCLLEERPSGNEENNPAFGYSKKVVNSQTMLEKVFTDNTHRVDQRSFVKARLFDMLIGDWDRHEDQWLWARFIEKGNTIYRPIPRDRDQAFSKMDGIIPEMATKKWGIRKIQGLDYRIQDINGLNMAGMHLDRNFTTELTAQDWVRAAEELQNNLTDRVIGEAFMLMPEEIFRLSGKDIIAKLQKRRDDLQQYAKDYYAFLSREVNITGTNNKEIFDVFRSNGNSTTVMVYKTNKAGERDGYIYYRTFYGEETKEIRLYGLEGDDIFHISGDTKKGILVRVIGGKGEDKYIDQSRVVAGDKKTKIYDDANNIYKTNFETRNYISNDSLKNGYNRRSFKFDWLAPVQRPGYNPDDGLYLGGGFIYKKQAFGKEPYGSMQSISGNYAFQTGAYTFRYNGIFKEALGKWDLNVDAQVNAPNYVRNYYGLGNETENLETTKNYYRVRFNQVIAGSALQRQLGKKHTISLGGEFNSYKVENSEDRFVSSGHSQLDSADFGRKHYAVAKFNYEFNTTDYALYPRKGIKLNAGARYVQNTRESDLSYVQLYSEASLYVSKGAFTLANRTGIATNTGDDYEFFQANTLGGSTNLRGYRRDRFAGKTSVYHNTELRVRFSNINMYWAKGVWGLLAFSDHGRVWMPGEDSNKWHFGYGGGVWFLPFNKMALTATYGISNEDKLLSVSAGFLF